MNHSRHLCIMFAAGLCLVSCSCHKTVRHPSWSRNAVIYEMNIRQFTPEGTIAAAAEHLPRLKALGVDIIWVMPIQTIGSEDRKGTLGSYYSIKDYFEINPEAGTSEDFERFVAKAHSQGQKVILDWVANHTSRDAVWLSEHKSWYRLDSLGRAIAPEGWDDVAALDYGNDTMRRAMTDAMREWIERYGLDGLRCDVAWSVPRDYWDNALPELRHANPELFFLAEAEEPELHRHAFDMTYAWELHHLFNDIAKGTKNADDLRAQVTKEHRTYAADDYRMLFTSNHDENSWAGTERERLGAADKTFAALTYMLEGMPLIYNGQEAGFDRRLAFFEKDSIDWCDRGGYTEFYTRMNALRHSHPALWSGYRGGRMKVLGSTAKEIFAVRRSLKGDTVTGLFNLSDKEVESAIVKIDEGTYKDYFTGEEIVLSAKKTFKFAPWQYIILVKNEEDSRIGNNRSRRPASFGGRHLETIAGGTSVLVDRHGHGPANNGLRSEFVENH